MIVPMKKAVLFVVKREEEAALQKLKNLGVLHVDAIRRESAPLAELVGEKETLERAVRILSAVKTKRQPRRRPGAGSGGLEQARAVIALQEELEAARNESLALAEQIERLAPWGDFDPASLVSLRGHGIAVGLYELSKKDLPAPAPGLSVFPLAARHGFIYTVLVAFGPGAELPAHPVKLPAESTAALKQRLAAGREAVKERERRLEEALALRPDLERALADKSEAVEFEEVRLSCQADPGILHLSGFVPAPDAAALQTEARAQGWGIMVSDPAPGDDVPTFIRQPKPVRIIQPIFDFMGTVPGYREYDISFIFLAFFSIFVAMLIGDAGYGILFIVLSILGRFILKKIPPALFWLLMLTGGATVVWGALTGTWFSSPVLAQAPVLKDLVIEPIATFSKTDNQSLMMFICFIIGVTHLSLAHLASIIRNRWTFKMISEIGRLAVLWGVFFLALNLVLMQPLNPATLYLAFGGFGIIIVFEQQRAPSGPGAGQAILAFLKGIGFGLANILLTVLSIVSALADVISYVRLFAVGLAGVKIAQTFNGMAATLGGAAGVAGFIFAGIILVIGHALNMGLGLISVLVHGVRLNLMEFSGHMGMEWSGRLYKPFAARLEQGE